jgi:integrase
MKERENVGIALTDEQEQLVLAECSKSRSRALVVFITLALYTGRRFGVLRILQWKNINFATGCIDWGKGKTAAGDYQTLPMSRRVSATLAMWAENFPNRKPEHYVFPSERAGATGHLFGKMERIAYATTPEKPMGSNKTAWQEAKSRCKVECRIHDMRHTAATRMISNGVPLLQVAELLGWSASQTVLMAKRYAHFNKRQLLDAVEMIDTGESPVFPPVSPDAAAPERAN